MNFDKTVYFNCLITFFACLLYYQMGLLNFSCNSVWVKLKKVQMGLVMETELIVNILYFMNAKSNE